MDTDFHYFGTGTAALWAGFTKEEASLIANAAEYVDFFNTDYWSNWNIVDDKNEVRNKISEPQLSCQTIGWRMAIPYEYSESMWDAFHFPPGNYEYVLEDSVVDWKKDFKKKFVARSTSLKPNLSVKLCRPYSKFALDLIDDTIKTFKELSEIKEEAALNTKVEKLIGPVKRLTVKDGRTLALIFLGIRMHVLADTWAHQDFTGEAEKRINGAGILNSVFIEKAEKEFFTDTVWTGSLWALHGDTDCAAAPNAPGSKACRGHGQVGHFPDYSWLRFVYPAAWLPQKGLLFRDNPKEYDEAWTWLTFVLKKCTAQLDEKISFDTIQIPDNIKATIRKEHTLNSKKLQAIYESEQEWKDEGGGDQLGNNVEGGNLEKSFVKRWNNDQSKFSDEKRNDLGVVGTLAKTRVGTVKIKEASVLQYMELGSVIHYQWAKEWAEKTENKECNWKLK